MKIAEYRKTVKPSKYRNVRTTVDGLRFDSKKEARRYRDLKLLETTGAIQNLRCQVRFDLIVNGEKIGFYRADFVYTENGLETVEDCKGKRTAVYSLKRRLMRAIHGIEIFET